MELGIAFCFKAAQNNVQAGIPYGSRRKNYLTCIPNQEIPHHVFIKTDGLWSLYTKRSKCIKAKYDNLW